MQTNQALNVSICGITCMDVVFSPRLNCIFQSLFSYLCYFVMEAQNEILLISLTLHCFCGCILFYIFKCNFSFFSIEGKTAAKGAKEKSEDMENVLKSFNKEGIRLLYFWAKNKIFIALNWSVLYSHCTLSSQCTVQFQVPRRNFNIVCLFQEKKGQG